MIIVTKIKRKSIGNYFLERCVGGTKNKDFWPTIKPFLTNKGCNFETDITAVHVRHWRFYHCPFL
jgi:hypothetical protein